MSHATRQHDEQVLRILELHDQGKTNVEIAKICGCGRSQVGRSIRNIEAEMEDE